MDLETVDIFPHRQLCTHRPITFPFSFFFQNGHQSTTYMSRAVQYETVQNKNISMSRRRLHTNGW